MMRFEPSPLKAEGALRLALWKIQRPSLTKVRGSIATDFAALTGGVYKTRERIHRTVADIRLLAIPAS